MIDRRQARILAMQALCLFDAMGDEFAQQLGDFLADEAPPAAIVEHARRLVLDVRQDLGVIDETIQSSLQNWDMKRLAAIDRNIMRVAVCELMHRPEVPAKVALNEAIEIGKEFGTKETAAFINGILDAIVKKTSPQLANTGDE